MPAVKTHDADLAVRLIDMAGALLSREGASALSLRRVASEAGTTTMAVYTLFGDKQGLLAAMYAAGFERLGESMRQAPRHGDLLADLGELGMAYRRTALANPHLYDLMFGRPIAAFEPDADVVAVADAAYQPLVDGVASCLAVGALVNGNAERIARHLWATSHGMVSLELAGHLGVPDPEAAYQDALTLAIVPFLPTGAAQ